VIGKSGRFAEHVIVGHELDEPVRPASDRRARGFRTGAGGHQTHDEVNRKRDGRLRQSKGHRVAIDDVHGAEAAVGTLTARGERGIQEAAERVRDVIGCHFASVVEADTRGNRGDVGEGVWRLEPGRQVGHHAEGAVDLKK
jgi:hypothetical protein